MLPRSQLCFSEVKLGPNIIYGPFFFFFSPVVHLRLLLQPFNSFGFWQTCYIDSMVLHIDVFLQGRKMVVPINTHITSVNLLRITAARNN